MNGGEVLGFTNLWLWLVFIGIGLFLVLLELVLGVETALDLVFIGSAFILGGLVSWPFHSWLVTLIVTSVICIAYVALGRRYVQRRIVVGKTITNIDAIIGKRGIVLKGIARNIDGRVRVGNEQWRARAEIEIKSLARGERMVFLPLCLRLYNNYPNYHSSILLPCLPEILSPPLQNASAVSRMTSLK